MLADTGLLGAGTVLAHGVHLTDDDIALVAASGAAVAHCPASNQKLASGFARIPELLAAGVPVALGTDGAASANDLDLWLAMRLAAYPLAARHGAGAVTAARRAGDGDDRRRPGARRRREVGVDRGRRAAPTSSCSTPSSPALTPCYDPVSTAVYARVAGRRALGGRRRPASSSTTAG